MHPHLCLYTPLACSLLPGCTRQHTFRDLLSVLMGKSMAGWLPSPYNRSFSCWSERVSLAALQVCWWPYHGNDGSEIPFCQGDSGGHQREEASMLSDTSVTLPDGVQQCTASHMRHRCCIVAQSTNCKWPIVATPHGAEVLGAAAPLSFKAAILAQAFAPLLFYCSACPLPWLQSHA